MKKTKKTNEKREYPCILVHKIGNPFVVLFNSPKCGMIIGSDNFSDIGRYRMDWNESDYGCEDQWELYDGNIVLSNG